LKKIIKLSIFFLTVISLYIILDDNRDVLKISTNVNQVDFYFLLVLNIIFIYLFSLIQHKILYYHYGVKQSWIEWYGLSAIAAFYNQVFPAKAGTIFRSVYLKKQYQLSFIQFTLSLILQIFYTTALSIIFITFTILLLDEHFLFIYRILFAIFILAIVLIMFLFEAKITEKFLLKRNLKVNVSNRIQHIYYYNILLVISLYIICRVIMLYVAFDTIGYPIPIYYSFLITPILLLSNFINVLPGNFGIKELLIGFIFKISGYELSLAIVAALVDRGATLIVTSFSAIIFKILLLKSAKHK